MQTSADLRVGTLVRWHGDKYSENDEDVDDVGVVLTLPSYDFGCEGFRIHWVMTEKINWFDPEDLEESFYQQKIEIVQNAP